MCTALLARAGAWGLRHEGARQSLLAGGHSEHHAAEQAHGLPGWARVKTSARDTVDKLSRIDETPGMIHRDTDEIAAKFMPGVTYNPWRYLFDQLAVIVCIVWFVIFSKACYHDDRVEDLDWWHERLKRFHSDHEHHRAAPDPEHPHATDIKADVLLAFHHPGFDHKSHTQPAPAHLLDSVLVDHEEDEDVSPRLEPSAMPRVKKRKKEIDALYSSQSSFARTVGGTPTGAPSMVDIRIDLLKDLCKAFQYWGFHVEAFKSVCEKMLFVYVYLKDDLEIRRHLNVDKTELQIRREVVGKLGIVQPEGQISSPPYIRYDARTVSLLYTGGVLGEDAAEQLYRTSGERNMLLTGLQRIRLISRECSRHVNLDVARDEGLLIDWFPVHSKSWLRKLRSIWGNWRLLLDFSFVQPVNSLREYFGSRLAFTYAWNGFFCKALMALLLPAVTNEIISAIGEYVFDADDLDHRLILGFSVVIICWSRLSMNIWASEEMFLVQLWEVTQHKFEDAARPSFRGYMVKSIANEKVMEKQYPRIQKIGLRALSLLATILFCLTVACCIMLWYLVFEGSMHLTASLCLSLQMMVFETAANYLIPVLTEFENHKHQNNFFNSYVWKQFLFQSVNVYLPFIYLAVKKPNEEDTLPNLRRQLMMNQGILSVTRIATTVWQALNQTVVLWWENRQIKKLHGETASIKRSAEEEQLIQYEYNLREQVEDMTQLVISLGFVLLFGSVSPIIVPLTLAVFSVQLRGSAYALVHHTKRPVPMFSQGLEAWGEIVTILARGGVLFSSFFVVNYGRSFQGTPLIARASGSFVFCFIMFMVWVLIDLAVPKASIDAVNLSIRRHCVQDTILRKCEKVSLDKERRRSTGGVVTLGESIGKSDEASNIENGEWGKIQTLSEHTAAPSPEDTQRSQGAESA